MTRRAGDIYDELLIMRCQDGDSKALETLTTRWHTRLLRYAHRHLGDHDAAHDVVQEGWLAIVRGIHKLDDPAMFKAWAYRILSNKCADWLRARVRHRRQRTKMENHAPSQPNETNRTPADDSENSDESTRLRRAMDQLTNEQRALLHLRYVEEMSVPMIADVFAIAEGTVKSRLHHLRETLRQQLAGHNENN